MPRAKNKDKLKEREGVLEITSNYFRLQWREPDPANPGKTQRRIEFFHGTRKEAIDERIRLQGLALCGKDKPRRKTLQDLADEFMANRKKKGRRSRTLEFHDDNLRVRIIPGLGSTSLIDRGLPEILAEKLTLHDLRDDYTTARFDRGDDIKDIQFDLDHENVITTWGYNHDTIERKKKAALENESELRFPPLWCAGQHATVDPAI